MSQGKDSVRELPAPRLGDRALFPDLKPFAYLNHAAISPPSRRVVAAMEALMREYEAGGLAALSTVLPLRERLREKLATLIGATPTEIGLCPNTSSAISTGALCFPWQRGDAVVLLDGEFPANVTPWRRAAELHGLRIITIPAADFGFPDPGRGIDALRAALDREPVRLVAVSAVQFQTGLAMPLQRITELCHNAGARVFVDGIQSIGANPLDVAELGIDMLGGGAHKWLMGVEGVGFFYARHDVAKTLRPYTAGWLSHEEPVGFLVEGPNRMDYNRPIRGDASFIERGSFSSVGMAALEAAVDTITELGPRNIHAHVQPYLHRLEAALVSRGFASRRSPDASERSCILCVDVPAQSDVISLSSRLGERGVSVSTPDGALRFAPHWPNALEEVDRVIRAVDDVLAERPT